MGDVGNDVSTRGSDGSYWGYDQARAATAMTRSRAARDVQYLYGRAHNDTLNGGADDDFLYGGVGSRYLLEGGAATTRSTGRRNATPRAMSAPAVA